MQVDVDGANNKGTVTLTIDAGKFDSKQALSKLQEDWPEAKPKG